MLYDYSINKDITIMDSETIKGKPLTRNETKVLLSLIEDSKVISSKTTNATSNKLKTDEWLRITEIFNTTATTWPRTPQQLRLKWENLKKNARRRSSKIKLNETQASGVPEYIPPDEILDLVTDLLDGKSSGIVVPSESDNSSDSDLTGTPVMTPETVLSFGTPGTVKEIRSDENRAARNMAIMEYFVAKKKCIDQKLQTISLENDNLKLRNCQLQLQNERLTLETEKLKLEIESMKSQL